MSFSMDELDYLKTPSYIFNPSMGINVVPLSIPRVRGSPMYIGSYKGIIALRYRLPLENARPIGEGVKEFIDRGKFVLWNPTLKECSSVDWELETRTLDDCPIYGLGCQEEAWEADEYYFIVAFNVPSTDLQCVELQMINVTGNITRIRVQQGIKLPGFIKVAGVTAKGYPHWAVQSPGEIIRFNPNSMLIERQPTPKGLVVDNLVALERELAVGGKGRNPMETEIEVWVQERYWDERSWTLRYRISISGQRDPVFGPLASIGSVLYGEGRENIIEDIVSYDGENVAVAWVTPPAHSSMSISFERSVVSPKRLARAP